MLTQLDDEVMDSYYSNSTSLNDSVCAFGLRARASGLISPGSTPCDCRTGLALALAILCYVHSQVSLPVGCLRKTGLIKYVEQVQIILLIEWGCRDGMHHLKYRGNKEISRGGSRIEGRGVLLQYTARGVARAKFCVPRPLLTSFPRT